MPWHSAVFSARTPLHSWIQYVQACAVTVGGDTVHPPSGTHYDSDSSVTPPANRLHFMYPFSSLPSPPRAGCKPPARDSPPGTPKPRLPACSRFHLFLYPWERKLTVFSVSMGAWSE
ncbi:hypothetical protein FB45DRAFT_910839 [Roridomyces roridus]|uniref:Uncharacterized protein n=1 Tax=Roridomyces roridus TaxID=1738132 RepID=A0AAD7FRK2_9AGAR|nr:hypothetical protein FB45DRAFT_910839 [Roridomyces roridus]